MENAVKTNRLAVVSIASGLVVLLSLGFYWGLHWAAFSPAVGTWPEPVNRLLIAVMDFSVPVRNLGAIAALLMGILGLREIKKKAGTEKGKLLCWVGIILGAGWIVLGLLVGLTFMLAEILQGLPGG